MHAKKAFFIYLRYIFLVLIALGNLSLIYALATPATSFASFFFIKLLYPQATLLGNILFFKGYYATLIPACIAGAAYYLLIVLNLATPMPLGKRLSSLAFSITAFFVLNVARIVLFAKLFEAGYAYFDLTHLFTWYLGSTLLVALLWILAIALFKIQAIPFYTDITYLRKA